MPGVAALHQWFDAQLSDHVMTRWWDTARARYTIMPVAPRRPNNVSGNHAPSNVMPKADRMSSVI
jgi:hypothetical protein